LSVSRTQLIVDAMETVLTLRAATAFINMMGSWKVLK